MFQKPDLQLIWDRLLLWLATALALVSLLALASRFARYLELLSHFRAHYFWAAVAVAALALISQKRRLAVFMLTLAALSAALIFPWYVDGDQRAANGDEIRVLLSNVLTANPHHDRLLNLVEIGAFDLLLLQETSQIWIDQLAPLEATYPHRIAVPRDDNFGIAIYSRFPLVAAREVQHPPLGLSSLIAEVQHPRHAFTVLTTHPPPPVSERYYRARNNQLNQVAELARQTPGPVLLSGDLNITVWSANYRGFERKSGLINVRRGFGVLPTWPVPWSWLGIAIDHGLVSKEFEVIDVTTGPDIGSDHLPLLMTLRLGSP